MNTKFVFEAEETVRKVQLYEQNAQHDARDLIANNTGISTWSTVMSSQSSSRAGHRKLLEP